MTFGFDWISGVGGAMLIILGLGFAPLSRFLMSPIPQGLGTISYSTYLLHGTFLFALLHLFAHRVPPAFILVTYIPLVLLASTVFYRFVEKPAMNLGRQLTTRTAPPARTPGSQSPRWCARPGGQRGYHVPPMYRSGEGRVSTPVVRHLRWRSSEPPDLSTCHFGPSGSAACACSL